MHYQRIWWMHYQRVWWMRCVLSRSDAAAVFVSVEDTAGNSGQATGEGGRFAGEEEEEEPAQMFFDFRSLSL